jgi:hypothetical protein
MGSQLNLHVSRMPIGLMNITELANRREELFLSQGVASECKGFSQ